MNNFINNQNYKKDILETSKYKLDWNELKNKSILFTGITGLIGRYFTDLIMYKNIHENLNCTIIGASRDEKNIQSIFPQYVQHNNFKYISVDVKEKINFDENIDYIIHAASNTYPIQYAKDPIGTIYTNVLGTKNLLELAEEKRVKKFIFISSFEVYGKVENISKISENDFGIVDCTILRSCYPESKRLSESLCIAFSEQKGVNTSIVRLSRVFGPTMNFESSLASAQFIKKGLENEDIVLKSDGMQEYSYNYVADAVTAILQVAIKGEDKEAYNVADSKFDIKLRDFAEIVANHCNKSVIFDLPDEIEKKGFSNSVMTILDSKKIQNIGWYVEKDIKQRIQDTINILKNNNGEIIC